MKPSGDKIGLGYESDESNIADTSIHPKQDKPKLQTMSFVKSSLGQSEESKSDESQTAAKPKIWQGRIPLEDLIAEAPSLTQSNSPQAARTPSTSTTENRRTICSANIMVCSKMFQLTHALYTLYMIYT
ncbi:hypothetical protein F511_12480 [Dorcoceras hygrometricum]|nr:hypothetical protein F511_12480 [Dorcoceras hygrometricum]